MIENIGIDIVENDRISKSINVKFLNEVLTKEEQVIYEKKKGIKKLEFLCGRFAAKEAIIKALNKLDNVHFLEITILNDANKVPYVTCKNYNILVSISHEKKYTIAQAIVLK